MSMMPQGGGLPFNQGYTNGPKPTPQGIPNPVGPNYGNLSGIPAGFTMTPMGTMTQIGGAGGGFNAGEGASSFGAPTNSPPMQTQTFMDTDPFASSQGSDTAQFSGNAGNDTMNSFTPRDAQGSQNNEGSQQQPMQPQGQPPSAEMMAMIQQMQASQGQEEGQAGPAPGSPAQSIVTAGKIGAGIGAIGGGIMGIREVTGASQKVDPKTKYLASLGDTNYRFTKSMSKNQSTPVLDTVEVLDQDGQATHKISFVSNKKPGGRFTPPNQQTVAYVEQGNITAEYLTSPDGSNSRLNRIGFSDGQAGKLEYQGAQEKKQVYEELNRYLKEYEGLETPPPTPDKKGFLGRLRGATQEEKDFQAYNKKAQSLEAKTKRFGGYDGVKDFHEFLKSDEELSSILPNFKELEKAGQADLGDAASGVFKNIGNVGGKAAIGALIGTALTALGVGGVKYLQHTAKNDANKGDNPEKLAPAEGYQPGNGVSPGKFAPNPDMTQGLTQKQKQ